MFVDLKILSERNYQTWPSYAVLYEWEDMMIECLDCKLSRLHVTGRVGKKIRSCAVRLISVGNVFKYDRRGNSRRIVWIMNATRYRNYSYKNCIPIFLDFHENMVEEIHRATRKLPCYWVTSFDIYERLRNLGSENVHFIPISIPDKYYKGCREKNVINKTVDVIQFGRKNEILHKYMMNYCKRNPTVEYVYQTYNGSLTYYSTTRGELGRFDIRSEYMGLLASAKVSLVSSPGADKSRDFGNIDFFTPRFFESAAFYCHMIGRYTENKEAEILGIEEICPNVKTQREFDYILMEMLETDNTENVVKYDDFLKRNVTSQRMQDIKKILIESVFVKREDENG